MSQQKTTISIIIKKRSKVFQLTNKNFIEMPTFSMDFSKQSENQEDHSIIFRHEKRNSKTR